MRTADAVTGASGIPVGYARARARLPASSASASSGSCAGSRARRSSCEDRAGAMSSTLLSSAAARLRAGRARALRRARRRRLRRRLLAALRGRGPRGERIREHAHHVDGAGLGGQPRLADLRPHRLLDRLPDGVRLDRLDALDPAVHRGIGIVFRGAAYALRAGASHAARARRDRHGLLRSPRSSTPFALGAVVGGIASRRVPVGNAAGDLFSSWLNPTSILDRRARRRHLARTSRPSTSPPTRRDATSATWSERSAARALGAGVVAGALALAGTSSSARDAQPLYDGSSPGRALPARDRLGAGGRRDARARVPRAASSRRATAPRSRSPRSSPAGRSRSGRPPAGPDVRAGGRAARHARRRRRRRARRRRDRLPVARAALPAHARRAASTARPRPPDRATGRGRAGAQAGAARAHGGRLPDRRVRAADRRRRRLGARRRRHGAVRFVVAGFLALVPTGQS